MDGRYHVHAYIGYAFRDLNIFGVFAQAILIKVLPRILKYLSKKSVEPIYILLVDNHPYARGASTNYVDKQGGGRGLPKMSTLLHKLI